MQDATTEHPEGPRSTTPFQISRLDFRAPPFWPNDVELWISQLEAAFGLAEISRDETKFQATVTSLDQPTLTYVAGIVTAPPPSGKYDALKARLLQRLGQSKQTKILQVLDGRPMGDQKPSTVLAAMQHQAGRNFSDTILKILWTRRLPQDIRAALAASSETSLSKLAKSFLDTPHNRYPNASLERKLGTGATDGAGLTRRLFITDRRSAYLFLVDTGAEVSVIPPPVKNARPSHRKLYAANGSIIHTYGERRLELDLGLGRLFPKPRRLPTDKLAAAKKEFAFMMEKGICRPSKSPWANSLQLVPKKDGSLRPCGVYRKLNAATVPDRYPVPNIMDFASHLHGRKIFSTIDLVRAYHHVPVESRDIPKTAVITPFGLFEFPRMSFGLCNAAQTFQRLINGVLQGLDFAYAYIDDVLIASDSENQHVSHLQHVFGRLRDYGLTINETKCTFGQTSVKFLGFIITNTGILPDAQRVQVIEDSLRCHDSTNWSLKLPLVLLGIRSSLREDLNTTTAELVYGKPLPLPGTFFEDPPSASSPTEPWLEDFKRAMASLKPAPSRPHGNRHVYVPKPLETCSHVYLRRDRILPPLAPPYDVDGLGNRERQPDYACANIQTLATRRGKQKAERHLLEQKSPIH
ncbi:hypothetical protein LAZ67_X003181 [Cordylochernes scorpioides]|uniref:Reverse transcriptase domain-containing protein n=1 Tax=Cordylochernes scorpioides TaxID=51811 RepID=A0ABY6LTY9_9ARAC|nr:hypothetical protein LAZ67_X003181 [Cordylochernes scorpioides]